MFHEASPAPKLCWSTHHFRHRGSELCPPPPRSPTCTPPVSILRRLPTPTRQSCPGWESSLTSPSPAPMHAICYPVLQMCPPGASLAPLLHPCSHWVLAQAAFVCKAWVPLWPTRGLILPYPQPESDLKARPAVPAPVHCHLLPEAVRGQAICPGPTSLWGSGLPNLSILMLGSGHT